MSETRNTSSFRDPSGYVFTDGNSVKRKINPIYFKQFESLSTSGFYELLFSKKYLVSHSVSSKSDEAIVLEADKIPFISYPYEWSFPQYKHAALLTLKIQKSCLENGFTLKDASAFNITFYNAKPIFIDTLSFDFYIEGEPWMAYKQFIMHFLGPLMLSRYFGHDFLKTLAHDIDGVPLSKLSKLLPWTTKWNPFLFANIHVLARYDEKFSGDGKASAKRLSKSAQIKMLDAMYDFIENLDAKNKTEWDDYYAVANYSADALAVKKTYIKDWFTSIGGKTVIDMGGNDGTFSRELLPMADLVITADVDANAVGSNYLKALKNK
ncbi:MAG: class I SAM-dependent methyltransferase, partial [Flavobacterium sp.]|uniref:class I SAM-dependent methyltransferase n=1 Tax=Flavobacterium sp. TaxID=239 RepID=UPI00122BDF5B